MPVQCRDVFEEKTFEQHFRPIFIAILAAGVFVIVLFGGPL